MTDEKDEIIARWLGFRRMRLDELPDTMRHESNLYNRYMTPQGEHRGIPDFTSLDVLFKWCVPKLRVYTLASHASTYYKAEVWFGESLLPGVGRDQSPGEALRGAIVALIKDETVDALIGERQ